MTNSLPERAVVAIGPSPSAGNDMEADSEGEALSARTRSGMRYDAPMTYLSMTFFQKIRCVAPLSNAFFISALGMMAVRASEILSQLAVAVPSETPYSMTPPATGTKQIDVTPHSTARSLRFKLESFTSWR